MVEAGWGGVGWGTSLPKQSISESAKWSGADSLGEEVRAGAESIARGRVTSVGAKRTLAGLVPARPAWAPGTARPGRWLLRSGLSPAPSRTSGSLTTPGLGVDVTATIFSASTNLTLRNKTVVPTRPGAWEGVALSNF